MPAWVLTELLDLVLPAGCAGCGASGADWCARCAGSVGAPRVVLGLVGAPPTGAVGAYHGSLRHALLAYKERGRRSLVEPLAELLAGAVPPGAADSGRCWLVPAPSRAAAVRARGGDHVRMLAEALARRLAARPDTRSTGRLGRRPGRCVGVSAALRLRGGARDSVGLDAAARAANLHGRVLVRRHQLPPPGAGVLLVDDVVTTGATLRACAGALAAAGVRVIGAITVCDATGLGPRGRAV